MKNRVNIIVIFGLIVLIGWGIFDYVSTLNETEKIKQEVSKEVLAESNVEVGVQEGMKAPDFELQTLDGTKIKLSEMEGKKVILNFWATWCPPCKAEMPHMQEFYEGNEGKNLEVLAVNLTTAEKNTDHIGEFISDYKLTFPIPLDITGEVGDTYQAFTIPTSYIIDSEGIIRQKIIGPMDKEMMNELINSVN
ncbi:peroxiredoxin family protein [Bacillus suaedaesalsae]|uniref:Redoxin domain-containing protein n=1 Tax=Bacillus suaedaesalsae TaxID=2810349 RepID=A0ABS2DI51_9BACI|nr:redoxin domain-containing protein [Bacillus suaedaesalsae]MBM6618160.1 redoxin domain-containing protein [Bacillus suaedaesalsae]